MNADMYEKSHISIFSIIFLLILSFSLITKAFPASDSPRPNILLINIDDLGWKDLGFMGSSYYETPNIDRLAAQGMVFSNAYASASNCAPSRAALFSGQYAPRTGVYTVGNSDRGQSVHRRLIPTPNTKYLADEKLTIAEILQQHGYRTAHVGKWHISPNPTTQGFDANIGGLAAGNPSMGGDMGGYFAPYNNPTLTEGPEGEYLTDRLTSEAIAFFEAVGDQPFFMNFAPYIVHTPIQPKEELETKYRQKPGTEAHSHAGYAAMVETMDQNVGRLLEHLKQSGKLGNTFIVFTSDNGGLYNISKQWALRSGKGSYFEGGIRVPMIVAWSGQVEPGSTSEQPVSNIDFFPTLLEVAGIEQPKGKVLDGVSIVPVLKGGQLEQRPLFWHFPIYLQAYKWGERDPGISDPYFRTRPGSVIRQGPWKLHEYFEDGRLELYNLETDIGEQRNLAETFPEKTEKLHNLLRRWRERVEAPVPQEPNSEYQGQEE